MKVSVVRPGELGQPEVNAWHAMQRQTEALANPFLSPEFAIAAGRFRPQARVAVVYDGPAIAGFFAFERRRLGLGVPVGHQLSNCQGVVHQPGLIWDARDLLRACGLSVWWFDHLVAEQQPFTRYLTGVAPSPVIDLADGYASYYEKVRANRPQFCRDVTRRTRILEREAGELRLVLDSADRAELHLLMDWKARQCRQNGWPDSFAPQWAAGLIEELFSTHHDEFSGLLSVLYAGDKPVAGQFGLRSGHVLAGWFTAYDETCRKYGPGLIQLLRLANEAASLGIRLIDMGKGEQGYKQKLCSYDRYIAEGVVTVSRLAAAGYRVRSSLSSWVRRVSVPGRTR